MTPEVVLGIDIGGTFTKFGLVDKKGKIYHEDQISSTEHPEIEGFIKALHKYLMDSLAKLDRKFKLVGIGVGAPNSNYYTGTIEDAANLIWKGKIAFVELMEEQFGLPVVVTNDANAAALGEMLFGDARGLDNFLMITLGTGLGSGLVVNGDIIYGSDGFAGELGHVRAVDDGRQCGCGKRGCLETYVSATGIKRTVFELLSTESIDSEFRKIPFNKLKPKLITALAESGDPIAMKAFERTGFLLGRSLADTVAHIGPSRIFLFGGLAKARKWIIDPTKRSMEEHLFPIYRNKIDIVASALLTRNIAVLGAAALSWKKLHQVTI
ncbi:MAG: ROK family protein [Bacteroidetes bacterium]|nr:MAG: ROK family protein [Bacteroidota bacterium]